LASRDGLDHLPDNLLRLGYLTLKTKKVVATRLFIFDIRVVVGEFVGAFGEVQPCLRHGGSAQSGTFVPP